MAKKKVTRDYSKVFMNLMFFIGISVAAYLLLKYQLNPTTHRNPIKEQLSLKRTYTNYYHEVDSIGKSYNINTSYLLALIMLECSGRKEFKPRFEQHVFDDLKKARDTKGNFGSINYKTISDANDDALKNLSTSWGPFQLMGYQCIELDVNVADIRGEHAVYWGVYWIFKRYGKYLKNKDYSNAFHIHNTGKPIPITGIHTTHDPQYVNRGLKYIEYFDKKIKKIEGLSFRYFRF